MPLRNELQNFLSGTGADTKRNAIQTVAHYLRKSPSASAGVEEKEFVKEQEAKELITFANRYSFFYPPLDNTRYIAEGAEQKVYLAADNAHVIKVNDAIFYLTWQDYFHSLLLHNYFFPATAYELIGLLHENSKLLAVVKQPYIISDAPTNKNAVKELMFQNDFINTKNDDYKNIELGIILEDLHDENVLTNKGVLFFVDTVFYLVPPFKLH